MSEFDMGHVRPWVGSCNAVVSTTIRLRYDGHSTAYQRSLRSHWLIR